MTLEFVRESFDSSATEGAEQTYTLRSQDLRIEKRTTSYISLNSIDGLTLAMHVNDWWWLNEYKSLFGIAGMTVTMSTRKLRQGHIYVHLDKRVLVSDKATMLPILRLL